MAAGRGAGAITNFGAKQKDHNHQGLPDAHCTCAPRRNQNKLAAMTSQLSDKIRVLSLLAMLLLLYVHAYTFPSNVYEGEPLSAEGLCFSIQYFISQGVARFRVPMFFALSGYFFFAALLKNGAGFGPQLIKRARTIALPYLLWSLIGLGLYAVMQLPAGTRGFFQNNLVWQLSPVQVLGKILIDPIPYQLWFLRDLMVLFMLGPLFMPVVRTLGAWALLPPLLAWFLEVDLIILQNEALPFYLGGAYLALKGPFSEPDPGIGTRRAIVLSWLLLALLKTLLVVTNAVDLLVINVLHRIMVVCGLAAVWWGYDLVAQGGSMRSHWFYPYTAFSFFLFAFHEPWLTIFKKALFFVLGKGTWATLAIYMAVPLLVMVFTLLVGTSMKRLLPGIYATLTGGR